MKANCMKTERKYDLMKGNSTKLFVFWIFEQFSHHKLVLSSCKALTPNVVTVLSNPVILDTNSLDWKETKYFKLKVSIKFPKHFMIWFLSLMDRTYFANLWKVRSFAFVFLRELDCVCWCLASVCASYGMLESYFKD